MKHAMIMLLHVLYVFMTMGCRDDEVENDTVPIPSPAPIATDQCLTISGSFPQLMALPPVGDNGSYDPTMAGDPETGLIWMVFSRVDGRGGEGQVSTHLAVSDDEGGTWCYQGLINSSEVVALSELPGELEGAVSAHWSHEVPSLAYYSEAPVDQRWRMLWHRYLHVNDGIAGNDDRKFAYGWIASRAASHPTLLASAPEEKLFSAGGYHSTPTVEQYNDALGGAPLIRLHEIDPGMSTGIVFSEPGMQAFDGSLYVSLVLGNHNLGNSVVLIKQDQSQQWSYVSTLLTPEDARRMNPSWTNFSATDLFVEEGQPYLLVSPVAEIYEGVLLFELNLNLGELVDRDGNGPDVIWELPKSNVPGIIQTGAATYDPMSTKTGILYGDAVQAEPQFRLYATGFIPE